MKSCANADIIKTKQWFYLILLTALLLLGAGSFYHYAHTSTILSVNAISTNKFSSDIADKQLCDTLLEDEKISLLCNGLAVPKDNGTNTYYVAQNITVSSWQGSLSLSSPDYYLYFAEDELLGNKQEALRSGHAFTLYVVGETIYQPISLVFTGLPLLHMITERAEERSYTIEDIDNYVYNSETRYYGEISIFNANPASGRYDTLSTGLCYHERGATSAIYDKKNYSLKLLEPDGTKHRQALFDLEESGEWKLVSMFTDKSKIRDMTCLQLWEEMASQETDFDEHGAQMSYCEVILDGDYLGLYGVIYPIDEETLALGPQDSLFKILNGVPPSPDAFEYSMENNYNVAYPIRMRYPKEYDSVLPYWEPMRQYLTYGYWTPDANIFSQLVDLRNVADFYIFIQATAASDNQFKNTYMVSKYLEDISFYRSYIIPWDLNYSFGDCYEYNPDILYTAFNDDPTVIYMESGLKQLFDEDIAGAKSVLLYKYQQHRSTTLSTQHIKDLMQQNMELLIDSGAFERESKRWPGVQNQADLTALFNFVEQRMSFLDSYFTQ